MIGFTNRTDPPPADGPDRTGDRPDPVPDRSRSRTGAEAAVSRPEFRPRIRGGGRAPSPPERFTAGGRLRAGASSPGHDRNERGKRIHEAPEGGHAGFRRNS
ncbi:hypothetical protein J2853_000244 [Streptosporangium lutulentum]|uniref:Uncharacterized protein n=1 Tax=Streptosporangium lutulentum TaxID=1461250 RepID=A0ABT9Q2S8_9ACTN|nr:hypothetical protein [Streptosporangium lutulentum]